MRIVKLSNGKYAVQKTTNLFWLFEIGTDSYYDIEYFYLSKKLSDTFDYIVWNRYDSRDRVNSDSCQRSLEECQTFIKDFNEYKKEKEFKIVEVVNENKN